MTAFTRRSLLSTAAAAGGAALLGATARPAAAAPSAVARPIAVLKLPQYARSCLFSRDGRVLTFGVSYESRLLVPYDVRRRTRPRRLAEIPMPTLYGLESPLRTGRGSTVLYGHDGGAAVVDLRRPLHPAVLSSISAFSRPTYAVRADGRQAAFLLHQQGAAGHLAVWDLSRPAAPRSLGGIGYGDGIPEEAAYLDDRTLAVPVAARVGTDYLDLVDLSDPAKPASLDRLDVSAWALAFEPRSRVLALSRPNTANESVTGLYRVVPARGASRYRLVHLADLGSGPSDSTSTPVFSPDRRLLAVPTGMGQVWLYAPRPGHRWGQGVPELRGVLGGLADVDSGAAYAYPKIDFSPDGRTLSSLVEETAGLYALDRYR
ncbi:hypothetical protein BIV57_09000 [Mangrovactinospora gilvigrisea]|uniref:Uncharacterized protein n=1 Tax=Mangrovactinospora gilvigrisea TaxID=1428644 RepID=A0A1J7BGL8_9ACTN|nr:hypothetical protein [Mangrovactinospora gilvigrisea]OIV37709.1 hypothetical protein BIV57_09000 [Mangrovactinospora gilvigrisea]